jgi:hypothetical protein
MPEQPPLESLENLPPIDDWEPASLFDDNNAIKKEIAEDVAREVGDEARAEVDRLRTEIMTEVESLDAPPQGGSEWWDTDTWIQGGGGGGGVWSGTYWFGNSHTDVLSGGDPEGELLVVDLTDGTYRWADFADEDLDDATEQAFWVADRFEDEEEPPNVTYRLNNHTAGDIHARIT